MTRSLTALSGSLLTGTPRAGPPSQTLHRARRPGETAGGSRNSPSAYTATRPPWAGATGHALPGGLPRRRTPAPRPRDDRRVARSREQRTPPRHGCAHSSASADRIASHTPRPALKCRNSPGITPQPRPEATTPSAFQLPLGHYTRAEFSCRLGLAEPQSPALGRAREIVAR